jgi:hypothetical protein
LSIEIRCARSCFFTVIGYIVPPFTVASLAMTTASRPSILQMPVTSPEQGASLSYMSNAPSGESSRNGDPGSMSFSIRSRTRSFPRCV